MAGDVTKNLLPSESKTSLRARLAPAAAEAARARRARTLGSALRTASVALRRAERAAGRIDSTTIGEARQLLDRMAALAAPGDPAPDRWALAREVRALLGEGVESFRIARCLLALGVYGSGSSQPEDVERCLAWMRQQQRRLRARDGVAEASRQSDAGGFRLDCGIRTMPSAAIPASEEEHRPSRLQASVHAALVAKHS